jgi:uncharacterized membrane protein YjgN (DUF898 family)
LASNFTYGETPTTYEGSLKPFWGIYLTALALLLIPIGLFAYSAYSAYQLSAMGMPKEFVIASITSLIIMGVISFYLMIPILVAFIQARKANLNYNHLVLQNVRFHSTQRARDLVWIFISNLILIAITFGLFIPFAAVRIARYRSEHLVLLSDDLASFTTQAQEGMSAVGAEISDLFDMDIGIA